MTDGDWLSLLMFLSFIVLFFSGFPVGVDKIIPIGFHHHECVSANCRLLPIRIVLQGFPIARGSPFGTLAVKALSPRGLVIRSISALLYTNGYTHMINLADPCCIVTIVFEVLRPGDAVAYLRSRALVAQGTGRMRVIPGHETGPRWTAVGSLAVGLGETGSTLG